MKIYKFIKEQTYQIMLAILTTKVTLFINIILKNKNIFDIINDNYNNKKEDIRI